MSITDIATLVGIVILIVKAVFMTPKEAKTLDAGVIEKYEKNLADQLERNIKMDNIIDNLRDERETWIAERLALATDVLNLEAKIDNLENSIKRLIAQLESLGIVPVVKIKP